MAGGTYDASRLAATTGVYVGCMYTEFLDGLLAPQVWNAKLHQSTRQSC